LYPDDTEVHFFWDRICFCLLLSAQLPEYNFPARFASSNGCRCQAECRQKLARNTEQKVKGK